MPTKQMIGIFHHRVVEKEKKKNEWAEERRREQIRSLIKIINR